MDNRSDRARLFVFVRLHARAGSEDGVLAALRAVVTASRTEPGCVGIDAFRALSDKRLFFIHSRWRDEAAFEHHAQLPHTRTFIETVDALLDEPRIVTRTVTVAGKVQSGGA